MDEPDDLPQWHDYLFIGTHGHVVALAKTDGRRIWSTSLPRTGYSVVSILVEDGTVFCASGGRVFALDPADGTILWKNDLSGLGMGLVYLSTANSNNAEAVMTLLAQTARKSRSASVRPIGGATP